MRLAAVAALFVVSAALPQAVRVNPARLPARDSHQGVLVACDAYQTAQRAKKTFGKQNPLKAGILPIAVYIRNSTKWPVAITLRSIRLEIVPPKGSRQQLIPLTPDEVATAILHPKRPGFGPRARFPLPFPISSRSKKWRKLREKIDLLSFPDAVIAPGATVHGFFYFDMAGDYDALRFARFYVPDLKFLGNTEPIMFFEAPFSPAAMP
jgi:hypothetical protein